MKLKEHINYLQDQLEEFMDENKLLRDMAQAPSNFGKNRDNVQLLDRQLKSDYEKLIRVLQDDNYRLEEERAKLKYQMKTLMRFDNIQGTLRLDDARQTFRLTDAQQEKLRNYIKNLVTGETIDSGDLYEKVKEIERLKARLHFLEDQGFEQIKEHMEKVFAGKGGRGDLGPEAVGQLQSQFDALK